MKTKQVKIIVTIIIVLAVILVLTVTINARLNALAKEACTKAAFMKYSAVKSPALYDAEYKNCMKTKRYDTGF